MLRESARNLAVTLAGFFGSWAELLYTSRIAAEARLSANSVTERLFQQPSAKPSAVRSHVEQNLSRQGLDLVFRLDGLQQLER